MKEKEAALEILLEWYELLLNKVVAPTRISDLRAEFAKIALTIIGGSTPAETITTPNQGYPLNWPWQPIYTDTWADNTIEK